ncbi:Aminopeptidase P [Carabus blaptoides fortunei]
MSAKRAAVEVLSRVRALMQSNGPLQAYIVPWADAHNSEYLAECDTQRAIISGFTGSAGTAVITDAQACLWTDGRYYLQAEQEMDSAWTLMKESLPDTPSQAAWLTSTLPRGSTVAVDFSLITHNAWKSLNDQLHAAGHSLVSVPGNGGLVEQVWETRPARPTNPLMVLSLEYTGRTVADKLRDIRHTMLENGVSALVVTALDEVAWTLNLRGNDIEYNPVFFSYLVITTHATHLFIEDVKVTPEARAHLSQPGVNVTLHPYADVASFIQSLVPSGGDQSAKIWFGTGANRALTSMVPEALCLIQASPVAVMKAIKNKTEADGMRQSHIRDGAAVCRYFAWLESALQAGEKVTEASGARILEKFRSEMDKYVGLSFSTISSIGPNGAVIHYHPSKEGTETDMQITPNEVYLCDSGGQYLDGTTDITRTVHFGTPTQHQKECFTRVLKGQMLLARTIFPERVRGNTLDTLARKFLWDAGLDYQHGTSHGIGSFLNVHEGPMGISWRVYPDDPGLQAGMFLSNEPGYYEAGNFGVRLENIIYIVPAKVSPNFLTFETVTICPVQTKMIVKEMLTAEEIKELNAYHQECREKLIPLLEKAGHKDVIEWLRIQTEPI